MVLVQSKPFRMTAVEFLEWSLDQGKARYELLGGEVIAMAPEQIVHARRKVAIFDQMRNAIAAAKLPCEAVMDGPGVQTDADTIFIPDTTVYCGDAADGADRLVPNPVIIVEVQSPSSSRIDSLHKVRHYLKIASVQHYLVLHADLSTHVHHHRVGDAWMARVVGPGPLHLDPPGITIELD